MAQFQLAVIVCTYNRDKYLPEALESVKLQTLAAEFFELLIIDNNSNDNTEMIARTFIQGNPDINVRYFFEAKKGLSVARNRGLKEANAKILCYVDDDAILSKKYLEKMLAFFQSMPQAVGVGGRVIPKYESGAEPEWMNKYLNGFIGKVEHGDEVKKFQGKMKYPAGCNMTYTKDVLLKAGGFNNELTFRSDDKYIFFKVKDVSDEIYYVPDAYVHHYIDSKRLEVSNFKKLFLKTGNEEKVRIRREKGAAGLMMKFIEFAFKFAVSIALYILYVLKNQKAKGKYILISQWYTLKGFLAKSVFVR